MKQFTGLPKKLFLGLLILSVFQVNNISAQVFRKKNRLNQKVTISADWIKKYNFTDQELMSRQYYIGQKLVFTINKTQIHNQKDTANSNYAISNVPYIQEITLPAFTPGVAVNSDKEYLYIDFGDGIIIPFYRANKEYYFSAQYYDNGKFTKPKGIITINNLEYDVDAGLLLSDGRPNVHLTYIPVYLLTDNIITNDTNSAVEVKKVATGKTIK
jgi:hypothetical protein